MELPLPMVEGPWGPQTQSQEPGGGGGGGLELDLDLLGELDTEAEVNAFCAVGDVSGFSVPGGGGGGGGVLPKRDEDLSTMQFWVPVQGF